MKFQSELFRKHKTIHTKELKAFKKKPVVNYQLTYGKLINVTQSPKIYLIKPTPHKHFS